ncbi:hypothetical protein EJ02DRAFT_456427 [Clathrospora elynae]|uniref:gamma-glutamylcyclotransferase n=1 Tax=Clathrospora elynae TaxID=706981 RepID=A0A6A5SN29_9PLEO|nr:hypothetical protein EJ02DRAFT_456427 [Clathrospora elynae]
MAHLQPSSTSSTAPTIYFGYGSNLWLHQMRTRCPTSRYLGIARLNRYRWIINERGYANVVQKCEDQQGTASKPSKYADVVFGLVYSLQEEDERRLDRNEGVPIAYTKEVLECDFWSSSNTEHKVDTTKKPDETKDMLVYIDRRCITPDEPQKEYIYRMNQGIDDAIKLGVPERYVWDVIRKYIPEEMDERETEEERHN